MPDIFARSNGGVVHISGGGGQMANIELTGKSALVNNSADVLISSVAVSQSVRVAYFSTLGDSLYIYPLGNEMSKAIVTGLALPASTCSGNRDYSAAQTIMDFYNSNKASNFSAIQTPVKIQITPVVLEGFVEGMTLEISNVPNEFGFAKFSITMSVIPSR